MKKETPKKEKPKFKVKPLALTFVFLFSIALIVYGVIKFAIAAYNSTPKFESIIVIALGIILAGVVDMIMQFDYVIETFSSLITKVVDTTDKTIQNNGRIYHPQNLFTKEIIINAENSQEELQRLKEQNPILAAELEKILGTLAEPKQPKEEVLQNLSIEQLTKKLDKAVENSDFEKAAEIRDEIAKRTR